MCDDNYHVVLLQRPETDYEGFLTDDERHRILYNGRRGRLDVHDYGRIQTVFYEGHTESSPY